MDYEIDKQYKFPVKEKKIANGDLFYVISANGFDCEVKAFESQRGTNPTSIICLFKGYKDDNEPIFRQDFAVLISQIYKVGEVYEFKVKNDINAFDYYEVTDKNGFIFRLVDYGKTKIYTNQIVKAKVKSINRIKVEVSLVTNKKTKGLQFMRPDDIWKLYDLGKLPTRYLNLLLCQAPLLKGAISDYEDGNALWVIHTIDAIDKHLPDWLNAEYPKHKLRSLSAYHCICLNLLEKSEYLKNCTEEERVMYQKKIATALTHAEDYIVALNLMTEQREQDYIDDHLERLKNTGYLYNPEKTMRVIMSLFTMRQESVQDYIQDIFDIISNGHDNERFMTQFRQAFTEMLDVYIWNEVKEVNLIPKIYNPVSKQRVEEMVEALAILCIDVDVLEDIHVRVTRHSEYRLQGRSSVRSNSSLSRNNNGTHRENTSLVVSIGIATTGNRPPDVTALHDISLYARSSTSLTVHVTHDTTHLVILFSTDSRRTYSRKCNVIIRADIKGLGNCCVRRAQQLTAHTRQNDVRHECIERVAWERHES